MSNRVYVTGMGIISALGTGVDENFAALKAGNTGIAFPQYLTTIHKNEIVTGEVKMSNEALASKAGTGKKQSSRTALLGLIAAKEALASAGLTKDILISAGFINGTSVGGMDISEKNYADFSTDKLKDYKQAFGGHGRAVRPVRGERVVHVATGRVLGRFAQRPLQAVDDRSPPGIGREPLQPLLVTTSRGQDVEVGRDVRVGFSLSGEVALHRDGRSFMDSTIFEQHESEIRGYCRAYPTVFASAYVEFALPMHLALRFAAGADLKGDVSNEFYQASIKMHF